MALNFSLYNKLRYALSYHVVDSYFVKNKIKFSFFINEKKNLLIYFVVKTFFFFCTAWD